MSLPESTPNRGYQLPLPSNLLAEDVLRLRDALLAIDADVFARYTKAEVDQLLADVIGGAPEALDTLVELSAALGDDANFAATVANSLAEIDQELADRYTKAEADARFVQGTTQTENTFTATAGQTAFTLSEAAASSSSIMVTVDGVVQPTSAYSLSMDGLTLTLAEAPGNGAAVRVLILGVAGNTNAPGDDTVTTVKLRDGAVTPVKLSPGAPSWNPDGDVLAAKVVESALKNLTQSYASQHLGKAPFYNVYSQPGSTSEYQSVLKWVGTGSTGTRHMSIGGLHQPGEGHRIVFHSIAADGSGSSNYDLFGPGGRIWHGGAVESGSNGNGRFVKFPDGTAICWYDVTESIAMTFTYGGGHYGTITWTFPLTFGNFPVYANAGARGTGRITPIGSANSSRPSTAATFFLWDPATASSTASFYIQLYAVGRWF